MTGYLSKHRLDRTCKDTANGLCKVSQPGGSKCTDTCARGESVNEFYCSGGACTTKEIACKSGEFCDGGVCRNSGGGGGGAGGCSWFSQVFGVCSSGCPPSYPNQQYVCCNTIKDRGCNGGPACASYNPIIGETPCCYATDYKTCTAQETCTASGCQNVCTTDDKTSELYCSKCPSCQDWVQNCA